MRQILRPYQSEAVERVLDAIADGMTRVLYTQATGCGKTTTFAELTRRLLMRDGGTWRVLILAHRTELITQAYERVMTHCGLHEWEIGTEIASFRAHAANRVVIGSVQTCMREGRPAAGWYPNVIIVDEAHHAPASSYRKIAHRYGVDDRKCVYIGCTATAKRTDRLSLYAEHIDGSPVLLERKGKPAKPATREESVFDRHVYDFGILPAVDDGWLVPLKGHAVSTDTDINAVKTVGGDFVEAQLAKAVDNERRTLQAIAAWKQIASDRQTLVFCASVEHAHHAAQLWEDAGYTADAIDGTTDSWNRRQMFDRFRSGELRVLCNMGIATEGTDLPTCSCIVHLRPTKSWNLYVQMSGRGTRALPGVLEGLEDPEARVQAIAASAKPDCCVIDLVDLYDKCGDICSVPSILDLPVKLDLQGHSVTEAKKLLDAFKEVRDRVIGECPTTYEELAVRLEQVNLMRTSGARTEPKWQATDDGYRFTGIRPGYTCHIERDGDSFRLVVRGHGQTLIDKAGKAGHDMRAYLDAAARHAQRSIDQFEASRPKMSRGTLGRLTPKQVNVLKHRHRMDEIDAMPYQKAKALISKYLDEYYGRTPVAAGD